MVNACGGNNTKMELEAVLCTDVSQVYLLLLAKKMFLGFFFTCSLTAVFTLVR